MTRTIARRVFTNRGEVMNSKIEFAAVKVQADNTKAADRHHGSMTWADLAAALLPDRTTEERS